MCVHECDQAQDCLRDVGVGVESATRTSVWHVRGTADATNEVETVGDEEGECETKGQEEHVDSNKRATDFGRGNLAVVDGLGEGLVVGISEHGQGMEHTTTLARIPTAMPEMKRPPTNMETF